MEYTTQQETWLRRLNCYWKKTSFPKFNTHIGEIYEVDFGENVGTEFSGRHLAVCLSDTNFSQERMLVIPLSTKYAEYNISKSDMVDTKSLTKNVQRIHGGIVLAEAKWISKIRVFQTSLILKEKEADSVVKGRIKVTNSQLKRWCKL